MDTLQEKTICLKKDIYKDVVMKINDLKDKKKVDWRYHWADWAKN